MTSQVSTKTVSLNNSSSNGNNNNNSDNTISNNNSLIKEKKIQFPSNIKFHCENIMNYNRKSIDNITSNPSIDNNNNNNSILSSKKFDVCICLSVTKWIHLNEGDEGLLKLFHHLYDIIKSKGLCIIEYQPWKSYINNRYISI